MLFNWKFIDQGADWRIRLLVLKSIELDIQEES